MFRRLVGLLLVSQVDASCLEDAVATNSFGLTCAEVAANNYCGYTADGLWPNGEGDSTSNTLACAVSCYSPACPCTENPTSTNSFGLTCAEVAANNYCGYTADGLWPNGEGDGASNTLACAVSCYSPACHCTENPTSTNSFGLACAEVAANNYLGTRQKACGPMVKEMVRPTPLRAPKAARNPALPNLHLRPRHL
jgi:hypothetical protein